MIHSGYGLARVVAAIAITAVFCVPVAASAQTSASDPSGWDAAAAAAYLDQRQSWWRGWAPADRSHETKCVSCHTALPYALVRPALRVELGESVAVESESALGADVAKRVRLWHEVEPYYPDQTVGLPKTSESFGTEAILNALVLANRDSYTGRLSDETRQAFDHMWKLQFTRGELTGRWAWLFFDLAPWESADAGYFGAALAAVATGIAPEEYAASQQIHGGLERLRTYLLDDHLSRSTFDRVMLLWASAELLGVLSPDQGAAILEEVTDLQQADGGWSLAALADWPRRDGYEPPIESDGYATGLTAYVLMRAGVSTRHPALSRALDWLVVNQDPATGRWTATSLNRERDPESDRGLFMSDAATAFAALALVEAGRAGWR